MHGKCSALELEEKGRCQKYCLILYYCLRHKAWWAAGWWQAVWWQGCHLWCAGAQLYKMYRLSCLGLTSSCSGLYVQLFSNTDLSYSMWKGVYCIIYYLDYYWNRISDAIKINEKRTFSCKSQPYRSQHVTYFRHPVPKWKARAGGVLRLTRSLSCCVCLDSGKHFWLNHQGQISRWENQSIESR